MNKTKSVVEVRTKTIRLRKVVKDAIKSGPMPRIRNWRELPLNVLTRAERNMKFIESFIRVPEGPKVGQPIRLCDFQEAFIYAVYDNDVHTATAILSIARKNGKTALIACLVLIHLVGPEAVLNSQLVSGARSRDQASLVRSLAIKAYEQSPELRTLIHSKEYVKTLNGLPRNTEFKSLSADASRNFGISPIFALLDEVGQVIGDTDPFVDAITSSQGAYDEAFMIAISTQAPSDADMLSTWIDDAIRAGDKSIVAHVYEAEENCDLLDKKQWRASNPALGIFRSEADLEKQLKKASRLPSLEASARNLLLNQRVALERLFIAASIWRKNSEPSNLDLFRQPGQKISISLDLSARNDLTAAVLATVDPEDDTVHVWPFVFCPVNGIEERQARDRAPYAQWIRDGYLVPLGGDSMDYDQIVHYLWTQLNQININIVSYDRWRIDVFEKACENHQPPLWSKFFTTWRPVGQGYRDQSPSLENFESILLSGRLRHGNHPLLNMAASNAIVVSDPAGSRKLDKSKATQRIDPLIALHQAVFDVTEGDLSTTVDISAMVG